MDGASSRHPALVPRRSGPGRPEPHEVPRHSGTVTTLKVRPGTLESAKTPAEADPGFSAGSDGDAFGMALPH